MTKIQRLNEFKLKKYNSNILLDNIMFYLRTLDTNEHKIKLKDFINKTNIDIDKFLTFLKEKDKIDKANFDIFLDGDYIIFKNFNIKTTLEIKKFE